ncbi:hypothetical protein PV328_011840 [Microctonus aethiopoides]|uniref:Uncharacterized protein n=1 Tax=Microctonus aethiopoides TaxID=144406 RepID=A0AA39C3E7_9HYME|nr:hypothetical protein PV328_011840 [Microctonus aethiopoides]
MDSAMLIPYIMHIPLEWLGMNIFYEDMLIDIYNMTEDYEDRHGSYEGLVLNINNTEAALSICNAAKMWWYKRVRIEGDPRPPLVNYYTPLAPLELEQEWQFMNFESSADSGIDDPDPDEE